MAVSGKVTKDCTKPPADGEKAKEPGPKKPEDGASSGKGPSKEVSKLEKLQLGPTYERLFFTLPPSVIVTLEGVLQPHFLRQMQDSLNPWPWPRRERDLSLRHVLEDML